MAKLAVCVGINDYPGTGNDLYGCVNDANAWFDELSSRGFTVEKLIDKKATKAVIKKALTSAISRAKPRDLVVFTYSGHGSWQPDEDGDEEDQRDEGWCPYDIDTKGLLLDDDLYTIFTKTDKEVRLVMISDSCHSGSVSRMAPPIASINESPRIRFMPPERFLKTDQLEVADRQAGFPFSLQLKPERALLFSGCQDYEYSYDASFDGRANGAFTYHALRTLRMLKNSATYLDWYNAIRKALPSQTHPQSPNLLGSATQKKWKVLSE
jgi:metacaspase-1